jgi:hypothetical protein
LPMVSAVGDCLRSEMVRQTRMFRISFEKLKS